MKISGRCSSFNWFKVAKSSCWCLLFKQICCCRWFISFPLNCGISHVWEGLVKDSHCHTVNTPRIVKSGFLMPTTPCSSQLHPMLHSWPHGSLTGRNKSLPWEHLSRLCSQCCTAVHRMKSKFFFLYLLSPQRADTVIGSLFIFSVPNIELGMKEVLGKDLWVELK